MAVIHKMVFRIADVIEHHWLSLVLALTLTEGVMLVVQARAKPFWHDEVYTILASGLPIVTLWRASADGLDLAPPLNTVLTTVAHAMFSAGPVSTRLPPMLGFGLASVLVFVMVRVRSNALIAIAAALIPCFSGAFSYAYEARGYAVVLGLFALAMFGWSESAAGRHRARHLSIMAIALTAGVWTHYYAALAFLPIVVGELVRQIGRRHFDRFVWLAVSAAAIGTLPLVPLVTAAAPQAPTFWTRLEPSSLASTYESLLGALGSRRFALGGGIVAILVIGDLTRRRRGGDRPPRPLNAHEAAAGLTTLAIPAVAMALGHVAGCPFVPRYVLFAVVGFAVVIPLAVWRFTSEHSVAALALCLTLLLPFATDAAGSLHSARFRSPNPLESRPLLAQQLASGSLVLSTGLAYLQLWYYTPPAQRHRAVYVADPRSELRTSGTDTIDQGYLALARWTPVPVVDYDAFVREHRAFQVYVCGPSWLGTRLRDDRASIDSLGYELGCRLYRVRLPA